MRKDNSRPFNKKWQGTALAMFRMILRIWRRKNLSIFAQKSETWSNLESLPELLVGYKCYGFYPTLSVWFTTLLWPILNKWDKFWQAGVCSWSHMLYFFWYQKHLMAKLWPFFINPTTKEEKDKISFSKANFLFWLAMVIQYTILPDPCHHMVLCWWQFPDTLLYNTRQGNNKHILW